MVVQEIIIGLTGVYNSRAKIIKGIEVSA